MVIFRVPGKHGYIATGTLPSGDLTLSGKGLDWYVATARSIAQRVGGTWNGQYHNWIVPKTRGGAVRAGLEKVCGQGKRSRA